MQAVSCNICVYQLGASDFEYTCRDVTFYNYIYDIRPIYIYIYIYIYTWNVVTKFTQFYMKS